MSKRGVTCLHCLGREYRLSEADYERQGGDYHLLAIADYLEFCSLKYKDVLNRAWRMPANAARDYLQSCGFVVDWRCDICPIYR